MSIARRLYVLITVSVALVGCGGNEPPPRQNGSPRDAGGNIDSGHKLRPPAKPAFTYDGVSSDEWARRLHDKSGDVWTDAARVFALVGKDGVPYLLEALAGEEPLPALAGAWGLTFSKEGRKLLSKDLVLRQKAVRLLREGRYHDLLKETGLAD